LLRRIRPQRVRAKVCSQCRATKCGQQAKLGKITNEMIPFMARFLVARTTFPARRSPPAVHVDQDILIGIHVSR
jgi:hypothetical protein